MTETPTTFTPTPAQRKAKGRLAIAHKANPLLDLSDLTVERAESLCQTTTIRNWWGIEGFKEWLIDIGEQASRLEYLFELALDAAEEILQNQDPKAQSARVNMVKAVAELAAKVPSKTGGNSAAGRGQIGDVIDRMDRVQLQAFLEKNGVSLKIEASKEAAIDTQAIDITNKE